MNTTSNVIAVIIGRAGSKGLPGKNSRMLAGRPMVEYTIEDAINTSLIDRTIVSTDSPEMASTAATFDIPVIARPQELANDSATVDSAVRHAIEADSSKHATVVILYANVPLRPDDLLDRAIQTLHSTGADSVQSYSAVGKNHPFWMSRMDHEGRITPYVANTIYRRQDLPPLLMPDGGVIAVTRQNLFTVVPGQPHAFLGKDRRGIISPPGQVVDIDDATDLALAEVLITQQQSQLATGAAPS